MDTRVVFGFFKDYKDQVRDIILMWLNQMNFFSHVQVLTILLKHLLKVPANL